MKLRTLAVAGLLGLSAGTLVATDVMAQTKLRVMRGATSSNIKLALNRAVVLESDEPFTELSVGNTSIADVSVLTDRTVYLLGKATGRTTLTLISADGRLITNVEIQVSPDLAEFKERIREILPKEKIEIRTAGEGIVLSGTVSGAQSLSQALELAERYAPGAVTNLMNVGGAQQVMLKVRFAEMSRSVSKNLSASVGIIGVSENVSAGSGQYTAGNNLGTLAGNLANGTSNAITTSNTSTGRVGFGFSAGGLAVNVLLEALENKGMVRTLAEPNLTAISGKEATFLAGGEVPIPVSDDNGITVEYRPFGVGMSFTPTVLNDGIINLAINTSVSNIDTSKSVTANGLSVPGFSTRKAETVVEMRDGQSIAIAGLLQDDFFDAASQVPWIGDIPILGSLFRSSNYSRSQSELVVIVTPHLVTPVDGNTLALPTDRVKLPSEADLFLNGKTAVPTRSGKVSDGSVTSQDFSGSYGYALE